MSSHHSQKAINLHHDQIAAGKARRRQRYEDRLHSYLETCRQYRYDRNCILSFGFICFAYSMLAIPFYLKYVVSFWA